MAILMAPEIMQFSSEKCSRSVAAYLIAQYLEAADCFPAPFSSQDEFKVSLFAVPNLRGSDLVANKPSEGLNKVEIEGFRLLASFFVFLLL